MQTSFRRFTVNNCTINSILSLLYLGFNYAIEDLRQEHVFLVILWWVLYYINDRTRRFISAFSVFVVFWVLYDAMRAFPNYTINTVHIEQPYLFEKSLFGITDFNKILTPNEFFAIYHTPVLDFLSGFFYINWMPIPLGFAVYLFVTDKYTFLQFSVLFLIINITGFAIYYIYPAAPPWYVSKYGFDLKIGVPGSRAGLEHFDQIINYPLFKNIYNKNANVLAAMPSLHATYPLTVLFYSIKKRMSVFWISLFSVFTIGIWFSAVYSNHHYIIDVLAGILVATIWFYMFNNFIVIKKTLLKYKIYI